MIARLLRLMLAAELLLYAGVTAYAGSELGWSEGQSLAAMLALVLGTRAGVIGVTFVYAWIYRSPRSAAQRIAPLAALRMMAEEYLAFVALFTVIQPFERWFMAVERLRRLGRGEVPVLLVHGYGCNRGAWWRLRRRLEGAGRCVATVDLEPIYGSIDDYVEPLRRRIESVCSETGARQVILVSHSMGGLACRSYLARHGTARVAKLVTLGTPHRGSEIARIGRGRNARQMEPGSPWLAALGEKGLPAGLTAVSIYSVHDNFVMPQDSQHLEGADNQVIVGLGHLALLFSAKVGAAVIAALR